MFCFTLLCCLIIVISLLWKFKLKMFNDSNFKYLFVGFTFSVILGFLLELSVFNYGYYSTKKLDSNNIIRKMKFGSGIEKKEDKYVIISDKNTYIEFEDINKHIENVYIDVKIDNNIPLKYKFSFTDDGNKLYNDTPSRYFVSNMIQSKYLNVNFSGKTNKLKIIFDNVDKKYDNVSFSIDNCKINSNIPLLFSKTRVVMIIFVIFILFCLFSKSKLYKIYFDKNNKYQRFIIYLLVIFEIFLVWNAINVNTFAKNAITYGYYQHSQYQDLAKSFSKGKVYLLKKPPTSILKMDNPYDYLYRTSVVEKTKDFNGWDTAYYKGKYYSYFGVVPVITAYLPFYLFTGTNLPNYVLIFCICILAIVGLILLLSEISSRWFKKIPFIIFLLLVFWVINCCGIIDIAMLPTLYNVPIIYALALSFFGLYFWISSTRIKKLIKWRFIFGSICMALVLGCRPQLVLGSILIFPIFWDSVFKDRSLFSTKGISNTILIIIPYIIIGILLMLYNKIRFDSFFNFGANYNLTSNDMTVRGFELKRIGLGLFSYLFQPSIVNATYPFLSPITISTKYLGVTISEVSYGGVIFNNILLLLGLFVFKFKKLFNNKKLFFICQISSICAVILVILDTNMAGILFRYIADFSWLLFLSTFIILLAFFQKDVSNELKENVWRIIIILVIISLVYHFLLSFVDLFTVDMINNNPLLYFKWYYLLQPFI